MASWRPRCCSAAPVMLRRSKLNWLARLGFGFLALMLALAAEWQRSEFVTRLDEGLRDQFLVQLADSRPENRLTVVDINEEALQLEGPWPWPRARLADLAEILIAVYGVRSVGFDIVLPEPADALGEARLLALATHAPLALAQIFDFTERDRAVLQGQATGGSAVVPGMANVPSVQAYGHIANHSGLSNARCVGNIGYRPDADGVLRHTPTHTRFGDRIYPSFAAALLACSDGLPAADGTRRPNQLTPPANGQGEWRVPYRFTPASYTVISAADVLRERAPRSLLAGRHVLLGSSALGLGDRVSTPLSPLSAGVMVHAASVSGLLDLAEGKLQAPWSGRVALVVWSTLSIALALVGIAGLSAWGSVALLLGLAMGWLVLAFAGVAWQAEWSVTAPLWAYACLLVGAVPYEWWQTQRQSSRLLATFSHYVAQPVLDEIVRLEMSHSLKPTLREVTVLIADMEGYTRTTSSLSLDEAANLTKDFLGCLTRPVLAWRGTLDKYSGDGLVAFWGAPLACPDQADRAVSAALDVMKEVVGFNQGRALMGLPPVRVRIGIESGQALVGDLGTAFRSTYTAVGDCINFASRLEAAAKDFPSGLLIGPVSNSRLVQHQTVSLGLVSLRGTETTIEVFTLKS